MSPVPRPADSSGMPTTADDAARAAAAALLAAAATLRERPDTPRLGQAALRAARTALGAALDAGSLALELVGDGVACAGARLSAPWLACLRTAGVGALVLLPGMPGAECARLLRRLAAVPIDGDGEAAARALFADGGLPHVRVHAALPADLAPAAAVWSLLPPAPPTASGLAAMVARDIGGCLPRRLAALVLADLDGDVEADASALPALLDRLLDARDHAGAAWLLETAGAHAAVPPALRAELARAAASACDQRAFADAFARGDRSELLALAALALQLGDEVAERFASAAAAATGDAARFLADALPADGAR